MFGPPYRILFSIIIGWAILLFIYPIIAAIVGIFAISGFFIYNAFDGVRNKVTGIAYGFRVFTFERNQEPLGFWLCILLRIICAMLAFGLAIFGIFKNYTNINV
jgi:hypothetical protein